MKTSFVISCVTAGNLLDHFDIEVPVQLVVAHVPGLWLFYKGFYFALSVL